MHEQKAIVKNFSNKTAILILESGQKINWPIKNLPDDVQQGSQIRIIISSNKSQEEEQQKIAKKIINEILSAQGGSASGGK